MVRHPLSYAGFIVVALSTLSRNDFGLGAEQYSKAQLIAHGIRRIERNRRQVCVYAAGERVELPNFTELLVARPIHSSVALERLVGTSVTLVRSKERRDEWDIYVGVAAMGELTLPDNVFVVRRVFVSSAKRPTEVRVDGRVRRLEAGLVLLVLA